jgi:DNA-binding LytR/AlgR family response regulator
VAASALWAVFAYAVTHLAPAGAPTVAGRVGVVRELALNAAALLGLFVAWACGSLAIGYSAALADHARGRQDPTQPGRAALWVRTGRGETRLALDTVERFEAERDYVRIHARSGEHLVHGGLRSLCEGLAPDRFLRVHRSFVVNLAEIVGVERRGGHLRLVLTSGACVPVGRTHLKTVRERLQALQRPGLARPADGG